MKQLEPQPLRLTIRPEGERGQAYWSDVRKLLKRMLRAYGLRCVLIEPAESEVNEPARPATTGPQASQPRRVGPVGHAGCRARF